MVFWRSFFYFLKRFLKKNKKFIYFQFFERTDTFISGPAKIPVKDAVINNTRVRLRTKPNLSSDTWGYLNTGDAVTIKDKSSELFTIDGESWYWYKMGGTHAGSRNL